MSRYEDLKEKLKSKGFLSKLERPEPAKIASYKAEYVGLPNDYVEFLEEIGTGDIGDGGYFFYSKPKYVDEIYRDRDVSVIGKIVLFGDDRSGFFAGFDPDDAWCVVELNSANMEVTRAASSFHEFVADMLPSVINGS